MTPLYDQSGRARAWLDKVAGRILDLSGRHVAVIYDDRVHDYRGRHLGWWDTDHLRDATGAVALYESGAGGMGLIPPVPQLPPLPPLPALPPLPSLPALAPLRPLNRLAWSSRSSF